MSVIVTTDADEICSRVEAALAADPVRHTILGTILTILRSGDGDGWCAAERETGALAARSEPHTPVALTTRWRDVDALGAELFCLPTVAAITGPVQLADAVADRLPRARGAITRRMATRLYRLDQLAWPQVPGAARPATADDRDVLETWYADFAREAHDRDADPALAVQRALAGERVWLWCDPPHRAVSMAARRAPTAGSARIGPVYTAPEQRGRGYGSAVTAAATADILECHAVPVLFTDLSNPVSNAIYQRLGYRPVGDYAHIDLRFPDEGAPHGAS